jgi:hypothetical protein
MLKISHVLSSLVVWRVTGTREFVRTETDEVKEENAGINKISDQSEVQK